MGICESPSKNKNNAEIKPTNEDNPILDAFRIKGILLSDIEICVCKIIRKTKTGTGFFCEVPEKNLKLLITNNHVLDEEYLEQGNKILYIISKNENEYNYEIDLEKDRYKLTNKDLDFTIIEILKEDNVNNFLKINNEPYQMNDEVFAYQYAGGVRLGFSSGNLLGKEDYLLKYDVGTKRGSSGSPILLMKNSKVIGLHCKGLTFANAEKVNFGIPIELIINKISYIKCTYEIFDYNYVQIINNTDGTEVNRDIESKIKILNNGKEEKLIFTKKFDKTGIKTIYFSVGKNLNDMSFLFNNCSTLKTVEFISCETNNVTNMRAMFQHCNKLENLDLTNLNTSKVTNMNRMFKCCNRLKQIKGIENFNTSNVTNMREMFHSCSELGYLDLTNFDISKVTDRESIFSGCNKLLVKGGEKFNKVQNEIKKEKPNEKQNLTNEKVLDQKSVKSNNSYHYNEYNYNNYDDESYRYPSYKEESEESKEKKHCRDCNKSLESYEVRSWLGENYCQVCYFDGDAD